MFTVIFVLAFVLISKRGLAQSMHYACTEDDACSVKNLDVFYLTTIAHARGKIMHFIEISH
jgi:hypothetical protein